MAKNKDLVVITINSDEIDEPMIKNIKKQFKKVLKNQKVVVIGVGKGDRVDVTTVRG